MRLALPLALVAALSAGLALGCSGSSSSRTAPLPPPPPPPPPLSIARIDPTFGPTTGGTVVTITGAGFLAGTTVMIDGNLASAAVVSPTAITLATPIGAGGPADVVITNIDNTSVTATDGFMYGFPAPTVTAVNPTSGAQAGGTLITITGTGFQGNGTSQPTVLLGAAACTNVQVLTAATLSCITGASGSTGAFTVSVTNPDTKNATLAGGWTYVGDTTPPTFGGLVSATGVSAYAIDLAWQAATDNSTTSSLISYAVYVANSAGGQTFASPDYVSGPGAIRYTVGGLRPGVTYWIVVRARDRSANEETNVIERSAVTQSAPTMAWGIPGTGLLTPRADASLTVLTDGRLLVAGGRNATVSQSSSELYDPTTGTWTATTGSMAGPREQHAAVLLTDGRVLVAGGFNSVTGNPLGSAEIYDPATDSWSATSNALTTLRQRCSLTLLANGQALVAGGLNAGGAVGTSELYTLSTNSWTATTGNMQTARDWHSTVLLPTGLVLAAGGGGASGILTSSELYDPATGTWTTTSGSMTTARLATGMTLLRNGRVLVAGGLTTGSVFTKSCEIFNPATGTWAATGSLGTARGLHTTVLLPNGRVHAAGGGNNSVEIYDPSAASWSGTSGFTTARDSHRAALLHSGRVLVVGGQNGGGTLSSCEMETTSTGVWLPAATPGFARGRHTANLMPDGRVLVAGGYTGSSVIGFSGLRTCEFYDPESDAWTTGPNMLTARWGNSQTLLPDGRVLAIGGTSTGSNVVGVEIYDPAIGTWSGATAPTISRMNFSGTLLRDGRVLIAGGWDGTNIWATSEIYTPATDTWAATLGGLSAARGWHSATLLPDGRVLVAGGWNGFTSVNTAEIFDPATNSWSSAGSFTQPRFGHSATLLPDGGVIIAGGIFQLNVSSPAANQTAVDRYDPATNTWTALAAIPAASGGHSATLLPSGKIVLAGGFVQPQLYDPALNAWLTEPNLAAARFVHTATLMADGRVLIVGGQDQNGVAFANCERYEEGLGASDGWRPTVTSVGGSSSFPATLSYATSTPIAGTGMRGPYEGNSGGMANVAADGPIVQVSGPFGATTGYLDGSPARRTLTFTATFNPNGSSVTIMTPASGSIPKGFYHLRIITNGIASKAVVVLFP